MYKKIKPQSSNIKINNSYEGETLEEKIQRIITNKEPIKDSAPQIFTARKDGVLPAYNIRTDRWEIAAEASDKLTKNHLAKREERASIGEQAKQGMQKENGGPESIQATT